MGLREPHKQLQTRKFLNKGKPGDGGLGVDISGLRRGWRGGVRTVHVDHLFHKACWDTEWS